MLIMPFFVSVSFLQENSIDQLIIRTNRSKFKIYLNLLSGVQNENKSISSYCFFFYTFN